MTARWIALLPDPVTGHDAPIVGNGGAPLEWLAPDNLTASNLAAKDLTPNQLRVASIVSVVDWESRQREPQHKKPITRKGSR